jgi:hypothetical protein
MSEKNKDQIIHWVSGKGGVGKSTIAAALSLSLARAGFKTLLIELGEKSFFRFIFETEVEHDPKVIGANLSVARWFGEDCLREYLLHLFKLEKVVQLFFENRVMKSLIQAAPGLRELALAGKITSGVRGIGRALPFDRLVIDGYSTGHFRTLIESPRAMANAIPVGPMGEQSRSIDQVLKSSTNCKYHVVVAPEELPVTEGLELCEFIRTRFLVEPDVVLNRWLDPPLNRQEIGRLPSTEFTQYLEFLLARQERLASEIQSQIKHVKQVPYSWDTSARVRMEKLSSLWDQQWK